MSSELVMIAEVKMTEANVTIQSFDCARTESDQGTICVSARLLFVALLQAHRE